MKISFYCAKSVVTASVDAAAAVEVDAIVVMFLKHL